MSNILFIDNAYYRICEHVDEIRHLDEYQKVRDEINRRFNPLAGSTDWELVRDCCDTLARKAGVDLMMSGYFAVASLKTQGLAGYANGLELLSACLNSQNKPDAKYAKMHKEVLDWVNGKVVPELKAIKPNYESLRELYRCERLCERIHHQLEQQQPDYPVDFESVGFVLFEHIDRIETQYHSLVKRQMQQQAQEPPKVLRSLHRKWVGAAFVLGGLLFGAGVWAYQVLPWFSHSEYSAEVKVATLNSDQALHQFQLDVSPGQVVRWKEDLVGLYQHSIVQKSAASVEQSKREAMHEMSALMALYPQDPKVAESQQAFSTAQQEALAQTDIFVQRFGEMRTRMANIALLAKRGRWNELQRQTKSLQDFAVSLSPIYGRVDYVQSLIKQGEVDDARKELDILKLRLNNLSWTMAQLEENLSAELAR
ncbi:type VI secretion system ImpA family N-terminal domain-containing protein [Vibrio ostreae]|uniref:Type VI secretion system ImpA family N-terminal domain-containing protein n=1 Tax=Vibrio ostreae TaxID=2841925 RepID=A0A975YLX1_9VIBR|nr:type VI secretion system ImpA family N-terminal domain-containing protein [Vibrio ostreae]QXO15825.1 type VI secretion system ImpA family N-terminal domain-containing protein [Vibrio ostreae]